MSYRIRRDAMYGVRMYGVRMYGIRMYGVRMYGIRMYGVRMYDVRMYGIRTDAIHGVPTGHSYLCNRIVIHAFARPGTYTRAMYFRARENGR